MLRNLVAALLYLVTGHAFASVLLEQHEPTVVYTGTSTVPAKPYYSRMTTKKERQVQVPAGAFQGLSLNSRLPLQSTQLMVGRPDMMVVDGLVSPLFVMGMDETSMQWYAKAAAGLASMNARGIIVQANNAADWRRFEQMASDNGTPVMLLDGDSLAEGYQIKTYPMVLVSPALAEDYSSE